MKLYLCSFALVVLGALVIPTNSQAYSVTNSTATDLGNGYALFTVTYKFGFLNRELYMPIEASRNTKFTDKGEDVRYSILLNDETGAQASTSKITNDDTSYSLNYNILPGTAKGIVVSNAEIKDDRYYLPKGKSETFTLVTLVNMSNSPSKENLSLQMTSLPFTLVDGRKETNARLQATELESYKTPKVTLK